MSYPVREKLLNISFIKEQPSEVIDWLVSKGTYISATAGEVFFKKGDPVDRMLIILEGEVSFMIEAGGNFLKAGSAKTGDITGVLPYSRMKEAGGSSYVEIDTHCLAYHKNLFPEMEQISPSLIQNLVAMMSDRVRSFTVRQQQREKMEALGKMSAGIAHEINNPASAIRSTSRELEKKWHNHQQLTFKLISSGLNLQILQKAKSILDESSEENSKLSLLKKSNLEDEMIDFLDDLGFEDSLDLAEILVQKGVVANQIEETKKLLGEEHLEGFLKYFVESNKIENMISDILEASERISKLVGSIKSHSHMDRAPEASEFNLTDGIESTLIIFQHKLKDKNIRLEMNFEENLPKFKGMEGELNQVWTNIIDNALDALEENGLLSISVFVEKSHFHIHIKDNGPGIPDTIKDQIFDPFFTTKSIGKGSGLGLDISNRIIKEHDGEISVSSQPGETLFDISLPIK